MGWTRAYLVIRLNVELNLFAREGADSAAAVSLHSLILSRRGARRGSCEGEGSEILD